MLIFAVERYTVHRVHVLYGALGSLECRVAVSPSVHTFIQNLSTVLKQSVHFSVYISLHLSFFGFFQCRQCFLTVG